MDEVVVKPSGETVKNIGTLDYVQDGVLHVGAEARAVQVESQDDLEGLTGYSPGSIAFTAGFVNIWQLGADGVYVDMLASGEGGGE